MTEHNKSNVNLSLNSNPVEWKAQIASHIETVNNYYKSELSDFMGLLKKSQRQSSEVTLSLLNQLYDEYSQYKKYSEGKIRELEKNLVASGAENFQENKSLKSFQEKLCNKEENESEYFHKQKIKTLTKVEIEGISESSAKDAIEILAVQSRSQTPIILSENFEMETLDGKFTDIGKTVMPTDEDLTEVAVALLPAIDILKLHLETESNTIPETDLETELETKVKTKPKTDLNIEQETEPETELEIELEAELKTKPETEPETKPKSEPEIEPEVDLETEPETKLATETETEPETEPETDSETEPETELHTTLETDLETMPKTQLKTEQKTELKKVLQTEPVIIEPTETQVLPQILEAVTEIAKKELTDVKINVEFEISPPVTTPVPKADKKRALVEDQITVGSPEFWTTLDLQEPKQEVEIEHTEQTTVTETETETVTTETTVTETETETDYVILERVRPRDKVAIMEKPIKKRRRTGHAVNFFKNSRILNSPAFVCDRTKKSMIYLNVSEKVRLESIGFLGPLDADATYNVMIQINKMTPRGNKWKLVAQILKKVTAKKQQVFHVEFEEPIVLNAYATEEENAFSCANGFYNINFSLKGPNTQSAEILSGAKSKEMCEEVNGVFFYTKWYHNQWAEFKFNKCYF